MKINLIKTAKVGAAVLAAVVVVKAAKAVVAKVKSFAEEAEEPVVRAKVGDDSGCDSACLNERRDSRPEISDCACESDCACDMKAADL